MTYFTTEQWHQFDQEGYLRIGTIASDDLLQSMQLRIDDIMLGQAEIDYQRTLMQLDSVDGRYESAGVQNRGHKGSTLAYRKIEQLERDPVFRAYLSLPVFEEAARRFYGDRPVGVFRAMMMNKPAGRGTVLPLHQDRWRALDRDPVLTVYTALDDATPENGCVEIIPGTHHQLLNPAHGNGFLTPEMALEFTDDPRRIPMTLKAGEVVLMHNWMLHSSGINKTSQPRRAFSVCYMDGETMNLRYRKLQARENIFPANPGPLIGDS